MSSSLGTLWFGADIDLTTLKQKIQHGNKDILDALKINYDPASYTQMVNDLKQRLSNEVFEIKVSVNSQQVKEQMDQAINNVSNSATSPKVDLSGLRGVSAMTRDIIDLKDRIRDLVFEVEKLKNAWRRAQSTYGENSRQAKAAYNEYKAALRVLQEERTAQFALTQTRARATLAQRELNKEMRDASRNAKQWSSDHMRLNTTLAGGIHISTQLGSALSSLFAVDAARQFLGQVIEIGGQLEKQRISIGAILGDVVKANHLFEQIKGLALKSPFGVVELDQYTKQLSAYGFKYSELFDMTKRLADISAGAGQDIGRLTLALGHVRSATYLTGITLRQFSMNNIPMLKMLADYYTELEGKIVSTAEVQKRISKRQVSYEDVIEQIRRLTNEGGMFYNMQEKISDSLAAKFKNLKDALDIMYGEIAESSFGSFMKDMATELTAMTRHWKEIGTILGVASAAFVYSKLRIGAATVTMQGNTAATLRQIMANKQLEASNLRAIASYRTLTAAENRKIATSKTLTAEDIRQAMATKQLTRDEVLNAIALGRLSAAEARALVMTKHITEAEERAAIAAGKWKTALTGLQASLRNAFMGVGPDTWATIGVMVGMELYSAYSNWADKIESKAKEMQDVIKSRVIDLQKQQKILDNSGQPKDLATTKARVDEMKQVLSNSEAYTKTLDEQLKTTTDINKQYAILSKAIGDTVEKNKKMLDYQEKIAGMIKHSSGEFWSLNVGENLRWFFNDDINKNMTQTLDSYKDLRTVIDTAWEYKDAIKSVIEEMEKSGEISGAFAERLREAPFEEQIRLLAESKYWDAITSKIVANDKGFTQFANRIKEAANGVNERWEEIANDDIPRMMEILVKEFDGDEKKMREWALNNIDDFKMMLDGINDQLGVKEPSIRKNLKRLFYDYIRFKDLEKGLAEGAKAGTAVGAAIAKKTTLDNLLSEEELANIKDETSAAEGGGGASKDKILEVWKNRYDALKAYYDEVQKYVKLGYDVKGAMKKVKDLGLGDGSLFKGMDASKENYAVLLRQLLSETDNKTTQRAKLQRDIKSALGDFDRDGTKEQMDRNVDIMKDYIKVMDAQWKLYRDVMNKTNNRELASLAFNDGVMWDEVSRKLLEEFSSKGSERGVIPVNFSWRMNEKDLEDALRDADGIVQTDMVELAKEIQRIIRGNYTNFIKESADAYSKSLSEVDKLNELIRRRTELEAESRRENSKDAAIQEGYQIQIESLNRQIADQQWAAFKEVNDWGKVFGNLDKVTTQTLESMLEKLKAIAPTLNEEVQSTKAYYEAIDKLQEKLTERSPLSMISSSFASAGKIRKALKVASSDKEGSVLANLDLARILRVNVGSKVTKGQLEDGLKEQEDNIIDGIVALEEKFRALQDVLSPVIDLFDQLGEEGLSSFFSIGSNAFGSAAQVARGFKDLGMENLGPYGAAAATAISITSSLLAMHDDSLQKEIEASQQRQKEMENLTKNLEKALERSLSGIYNLKAPDTILKSLDKYASLYGAAAAYEGKKLPFNLQEDLKKNLGYVGEDTMAAIKEAKETKLYFDATYASLLAQRDEIKHQMEMEEDKKKSDSQKIDDYKQQLIEIGDSIQNIAEDMAKTLYDIDFKSWAHDLAQAIVNAWASGEDAAEAYKKKVGDILKDLGAKVIAERFISTAVKPIMDEFLDNYKTENGVLTDQGLAIIAKMYEQGEAMAAQASTFMDGLDKVSKQYGADLKETSGGSSMSAGIKAITESTADLLASYINAIRADVSAIRLSNAVFFPQIIAVIGQCSVIANTQVQLQAQIAANTLRNAQAAEKIYNILHGIAPDGTYVRLR